MKKNKNLGIVAILIVVTIYGVSYISRGIAVVYIHPIIIVAIQLSIMAILFTIYNLVKKKDIKIHKKDMFLLILSGLFGTSISNLFTIMSVQYIGETVSSLLFGFSAVFSLIINFVFFKRKKTKLSILSVIVSFIGVYILMGIDFSDLANTNFMGYFISLLSILSWVAYCFLSDKISDKYDKTVALNYQAIVGAMTTLPFILIFPVKLSVIIMPSIFINLLILGVMNSTIAYFLNIYAIKQIGVTFSNLFLNFLPVVTILVAFILYGTIPSINQIIGGMIIIVSIFILNSDENNLAESLKVNPITVEKEIKSTI